jgi:hypothetical protein
MRRPKTPQEIGREIGEGIAQAIAQAVPQAMAQAVPQVPQAIAQGPGEWQPPKLKRIDPKKGPVAGDQVVTIEFEENLVYDVVSVRFGKKPAKEIKFKPPSTTLLATTDVAADGKAGKVPVEIKTVYYHQFVLSEPYEYA